MTENIRTPDRRVQRTYRLLTDALMQLLQEKSFNDITISEVTRVAGLRRATFYLHFQSLEELLLKALKATFDDLLRGSSNEMHSDIRIRKADPTAYLPTFQHVAEHKALYCDLMTGRAAGVVNRQIREYLATIVLDMLPLEVDGMPREALAHAVAGVEMAMILWWIENENDQTPQDMAEITHRIVMNGLLGVIGDIG